MQEDNLINSSAVLERSGLLLEAVAHLADNSPSLLERRREMLAVLCSLLDAEFGHWAWGHRATTDLTRVMPAALLTHGFSDDQLRLLPELMLDERVDREFRAPVVGLMGEKRRSTVTWPDLFADFNTFLSSFLNQALTQLQLAWFLHSVRFTSIGVWSSIVFHRSPGRPDFSSEDKQLLDIAMAHIPWLHATFDESMADKKIEDLLTQRQKVVMMMLLDGRQRTDIAQALGISEETVGVHLKAIYRAYEVNSALELAAIFLRGK